MTPVERRLSEELAADSRRREGWARAHAAFLTLTSLAIGAAYLAYVVVREWKIWS